MQTKKPNLDDFIGSGKADQHASKTAKQPNNMPANQQVEQKKVTYYISPPEIIKKFKQVGLDTDRGLSDLASEAIKDLVDKYTSKSA